LPEPLAEDARLEKAEALFERGQYAAVLAETRALLRREPKNARARELLEDAEVEVAVEGALKTARTSLARGDREAALVEVRRGLAAKPTDARLIDLFRQLTQ
jgi:Flp pilus assembly protein TadD